MVVSNNKLFHCLSHDVITCDEDCDLLTAYWWSSSSNGVGYSCITIYIMAIWCDWQILIPNVPVSSGFPRGLTLSCFLAGLMLYQSPVVFLDCWYPCFRNFDFLKHGYQWARNNRRPLQQQTAKGITWSLQTSSKTRTHWNKIEISYCIRLLWYKW